MTKTARPGIPWRQRRCFLRVSAILLGLVELVAFSFLTGCAWWGNTPGRTGVTTATTAPVLTATPPSTQQTSPWKLVWNDEFDGAAGTPPDPSKWSPTTGGGGWGNKQLDYDTNNQNAYQDGQGNLVLEARKGNPEGYECWYGPCQYTSAQISTKGHFSFTYGRLEARIKVPYGQGIWSAFWILGDNCETVGWPACGEVDVMENISNQPNILYGTVHGPSYFSGTYKLQHGKFADDFHVFTLQWDPSHLSFFVDGVNYATLNKTSLPNQRDWVYDHPFHIILNAPVGGEWPGSPSATTAFPQKMSISYVRVYTPA